VAILKEVFFEGQITAPPAGTTVSHPVGWCRHIHRISTRNSAQTVLSMLYIFT